MDDEQDDTPAHRPPRVVNPMYAGMVRALHNHALVLAQVRQRVIDVRDRYASEPVPAAAVEMAALGREFRKESDSAADVARQAEALARRVG